MEKIINIGEKAVPMKSTGAILLRYRMQFRNDALKDIIKMYDALSTETGGLNISNLDVQVFQQLMWVMAKTADPEIPELFDWLDSFDEFPLLDILGEAMDLFMGCLTTTKKK